MKYKCFLAALVIHGVVCAQTSKVIGTPMKMFSKGDTSYAISSSIWGTCTIEECKDLISERNARPRLYLQPSHDKLVYLLLYTLLQKEDSGTYLEIGAGDSVGINNACLFEQFLNWKGIILDIDENPSSPWKATRKNPLFIEDAVTCNYRKMLANFPVSIDYLSLDVDRHYNAVLKQLPFDEHVFKLITIEHDFYRYGDVCRAKEREILHRLGYYLLCADVKNGESIYEDWWIYPQAFPLDIFSELQSLDLNEKDHNEILRSLEDFVLFRNKN